MTKSLMIAALSLSLAAPVANAASLALDGGWTSLNFSTTSWDDNYTFTLLNTAYLYVTDAYVSGDMFEVFSGGSSLGITSSVIDNAGLHIAGDFDAAFASSDFSSAVFTLGAGSYNISGSMIQLADGFFGGSAGIQISSTNPVPVPAAGLLLLTALGGIAGLRRRKKTS